MKATLVKCIPDSELTIKVAAWSSVSQLTIGELRHKLVTSHQLSASSVSNSQLYLTEPEICNAR